MKSLFVLLTLICNTCFGFTAVAEEYDQLRADIKAIKPQVVQNNGVKGIWFNTTDADKILQLLQDKFPKFISTIQDQQSEIVKLRLANTDLTAANQTLQALSDTYKKTLDGLVQSLKAPETPWFDKPHTMFALGMTTGAVVVLGLVAAAIYVVGRTSYVLHLTSPTATSGLTL